MSDRYCEVCGTDAGIEEHHIIFRGHAGYLVKCKANIKDLCNKHHTGNNSPHKEWEINLKYKLEFKEWVLKQFDEDRRYTEEEIKQRLQISKNAARSFCKLLKWWHGGYTKEDIIFRALGNCNYWEGMKESEEAH